MIYITGDCHADFRRFNTDIFPEQNEMTKEDYVIICGDFGGVWDKDKESAREKWWLDWLESKPYTTLFADGNHENFDRLYDYPAEEWHGGKVHKIRDGAFKPDTLTTYLEEIRQKTTFKKWFFGHYHENRNVNANEILLYEQIIRIS